PTLVPGPANFARRLHRHDMLRAKARRLAIGPDVDELERPRGQDRQRERRAEDLPTALAMGAVQLDHIPPASEKALATEAQRTRRFTEKPKYGFSAHPPCPLCLCG